ncbi:MAG: hypothetical protein COU42_02960 [Candidatus Nealsonbacteria bacterium CG10_big_fil_rev_8_21_14_0_10_36_24]|uniref:Methyltransferase domain-containing protein n=2 Tax=Candidatus Nealsoniibacteriota TaxID=1817911 RepID=A0A2H0YQF3_9BACT|nr:MAG: hypothetical protein COU42_02960 [Candidatus Nealsonbacteria bacterium CG10_big_fil_rev_8_21_14_0_10_36_24]PIS39993.1 MAG: hypothetical protein COT32_02150 [Candidatus Nealsonbacteria bacterium CG08_land_8_20_14_0_20_36_22]
MYKKDFASMYDNIYKDKFYNSYAVFVKRIIKEEKIKKPFILDVACGTGRLINKLNKKNVEIEGLDVSEDMISIAKKNNKSVKFYIQDFVNFYTSKKYNIITCTFDSINYIRNKKNLFKFFRNVNNHLKDGGIFIFDFNTIYKKIAQRTIKQNVFYITKIKNKYWFITIRIKKGRNFSEEKHIERLYLFSEIKPIINKTDFRVVGLYSDFKNKIKNVDKYGRLIIVLKKY